VIFKKKETVNKIVKGVKIYEDKDVALSTGYAEFRR
jgi:hypothetical protein